MGDRELHPETDCRSPLGPGYHFDASAHLLDDLLADGEAKPRSAELPVNRVVRLDEFPEDRADTIGVDADAGVGYAPFEKCVAVVCRLATQSDRDAALLCEFNRIGKHVQQDLSQASCIAENGCRKAGL